MPSRPMFSYLGLRFDAGSKYVGKFFAKAALKYPCSMIWVSVLFGIILTALLALGLFNIGGFEIELTSDPELFTPQTSKYSAYRSFTRKTFGDDPAFTTVLYSLRDDAKSSDIMEFDILKSIWQQEMLLQTQRLNVTIDSSTERFFPHAKLAFKEKNKQDAPNSFEHEAYWPELCLHQPTGVEPWNACIVVGVFGVHIVSHNGVMSEEAFDFEYDSGMYSFRRFTAGFLPAQIYAPQKLRMHNKDESPVPEIHDVKHLLFIYRMKPSLPKKLVKTFENNFSDRITELQKVQASVHGKKPSHDVGQTAFESATTHSFEEKIEDDGDRLLKFTVEELSFLKEHAAHMMNSDGDDVLKSLIRKRRRLAADDLQVKPVDFQEMLEKLYSTNQEGLSEKEAMKETWNEICPSVTSVDQLTPENLPCFGGLTSFPSHSTGMAKLDEAELAKIEKTPAGESLSENSKNYIQMALPEEKFFKSSAKDFPLHPDVEVLHYNENFISTESLVIVMKENFLLGLTFGLMIIFMAIVVARRPLRTHGRFLLSSSVLIVCGFASAGTFTVCTLGLGIPMTAMAPLVVHMLVAMVVDFMIISVKALEAKRDMLEAIAAEDPTAQKALVERLTHTTPTRKEGEDDDQSSEETEVLADLPAFEGFTPVEASDFILATSEGFASITITTVATVVAMGVGATIDMPVVRYFFINGCVGVILLFVFHWTLFLPLLVLNERREKKGYLDLIPFLLSSTAKQSLSDKEEDHGRRVDVAMSIASQKMLLNGQSPARQSQGAFSVSVDSPDAKLLNGDVPLSMQNLIPKTNTDSTAPAPIVETSTPPPMNHSSDTSFITRSYLSVPSVRIGILSFTVLLAALAAWVAPYVSTSFDMVTYLPDESRLRTFVKRLNANWNGQGEQLYFNIPGSDVYPYFNPDARNVVINWANQAIDHSLILEKYPFIVKQNGRQMIKEAVYAPPPASALLAESDETEKERNIISPAVFKVFENEKRWVRNKPYKDGHKAGETLDCFNVHNPLHSAETEIACRSDEEMEKDGWRRFHVSMLGGPLQFWLSDFVDKQMKDETSVQSYPATCSPSTATVDGVSRALMCDDESSRKPDGLCSKAFQRSVEFFLRGVRKSPDTVDAFREIVAFKDSDTLLDRVLKEYDIESTRPEVCMLAMADENRLRDQDYLDSVQIPLFRNVIASTYDNYYITDVTHESFGPSRMMMIGTQKPGDSASSLVALRTVDLLREDLDTKMTKFLDSLPKENLPAGWKKFKEDRPDARGILNELVTVHARWLSDADRDVRIYSIIVERLLIIAVALSVTLAIILHPLAGLLVGLMIALIDIIVLGAMWLTDVSVDIVAVLVLCMAVGFSVEYVAHVAHAFVTAPLSMRNDKSTAGVAARERRSLALMGRIIFYGAMSAFLGIVLLAFAQSSAFRTYFKLTSAVIIVSAVVGLVVTPIVLSAFWDWKTLTRTVKDVKSTNTTNLLHNSVDSHSVDQAIVAQSKSNQRQ